MSKARKIIANIRGPIGPTGATGATGEQGPVGATGATGEQGPVGATGAQGPVGATGAQGPQGPQGVQGPSGTTPHWGVEVTGLPHGNDPTATVGGTDALPILQLGIPAGASGNETIDDTAGIGDTDLVYSADKVRKELDTKAPVVDVPLTTPASVQSFPDGADGLPMALTVGIEPVQDLHGLDNPYPSGGGKNKLPLVLSAIKANNAGGTWSGNAFTGNGVTFTILTDESNNVTGVKVTGTADGDATIYLYGGTTSSSSDIVFSESFIGSTEVTGSSSTVRGIVWGTNGGYIDGSEVTFNAMTVYGFGVRVMNGYAIPSGGITFKPMLRHATDSSGFAPYSNICPISGWTGAKVTRTGKNIFDGVIEQGGFDINGLNFGNNTRLRSKNFIRVKAGNKIFVSAETSASKSLKLSLSYYKNASYTEKRTDFENWATTIGYVFTVPDNVNYARITIAFTDDSNITPDQISNAIVAYSESETLYEPYSGQVYPITFPQSAGTVYGGTLTVNKDGSGELVVDRTIIDLGDISWAKSSSGNKFYGTLTNGMPQYKIVNNMIGVCSHYNFDGYGSYTRYYGENGTIRYLYGENNNELYICDDNYSDATTFNAAMPGVKFVYELATPVTYSFTPGQVKTMLGVNNLFADCGSITEVRYPADTKLYIDRRISELQALILESL